MNKYLVIDIGGTYIKYAIMSDDAHFIDKGKTPTPQDSREALVETIGSLYDKNPDVEMITISMPGIIDTNNNHVLAGGALRYNNDFYLGDALEKRCNNTKVILNNDAKCAASAEASLGALKDVSDGAVILFGTMIGGGIVINHEVRHGTHFSAGEVSYILCDHNDDPTFDTIWGNTNSTAGLCRKYAKAKGLDPKEVSGEIIFKAINNNDEIAITVLDEFCKEVAVKIFNLQTVLDLHKVAIGGGISEQPLFIETIKKQLHRLHEVSMYYVPEVEIVSCEFKNDANLIGALQFALKNKSDS